MKWSHLHSIRLLCAALPIVAALTAVGCSRWNWRGQGFDDGTAGWAGKLRPAAKGQHASGLDARATEIERNLGVK